MAQVTVRQVEEEWVGEAKAIAKKRGVSMNAVLLEAIRKGLGLPKKPKTNGLEVFAGDSVDTLDASFDEAVKVFEQIDDDLWK